MILIKTECTTEVTDAVLRVKLFMSGVRIGIYYQYMSNSVHKFEYRRRANEIN